MTFGGAFFLKNGGASHPLAGLAFAGEGEGEGEGEGFAAAFDGEVGEDGDAGELGELGEDGDVGDDSAAFSSPASGTSFHGVAGGEGAASELSCTLQRSR